MSLPNGQHVLVVDDEGSVRSFVRHSLEYDGFEVTDAPDGQTAMCLIRSAPPDLILLDVRMPNRDGFEILAEVRGDPDLRRIPVVMLTADAHEDSEWHARELGAVAYIAKPVGAEDLVRMVRRVLKMSDR